MAGCSRARMTMRARPCPRRDSRLARASPGLSPRPASPWWNPAADPRLTPAHREAYRRGGCRAFLGVPLKLGAEVLGVLSIRTRRERGFSSEDLQLVTAFAAQAAVALENSRLYQETQRAYEELSEPRILQPTVLNLNAVVAKSGELLIQ